jgi:uncharacterized membrane protein
VTTTEPEIAEREIAEPESAKPEPTRTRARKRRDWPVLTGLLLLAAVPSLAGALRVGELAGGAARTADNARFVDMPVPVLVHIFGAVTFAMLGAFQFAPRWRARHRRWHRIAGRIVMASGLAVAASGMWMTVFYALPPGDGALLGVLPIGFGSAMFASIVLSFVAVRRRDFVAHRAWMTRGYAIGMGAGTQVFTVGPWEVIAGHHASDLPRALMMAAGWIINLAVAEYFLRTRR